MEGISEKYRKKVCEIGNIIRKEILDFQVKFDSNQSDKKLKILILGGSQAARIFAEKLTGIFKACHEAKIPLRFQGSFSGSKSISIRYEKRCRNRIGSKTYCGRF